MQSTAYPIAVITHLITDMVDEAPVDIEHVDSTPRVQLHHFVLTAGHILHFLCQHNQPSCLINNCQLKTVCLCWTKLEKCLWKLHTASPNAVTERKRRHCLLLWQQIKPGTHAVQCSCSTALFTVTSLQCATVDPEDNKKFLVSVSLHYDYDSLWVWSMTNTKCSKHQMQTFQCFGTCEQWVQR